MRATDFFNIKMEKKNGLLNISPDFIVKPSEDLMVKGRNFYAVWDQDAGMWSTNEFDVARMVDAELKEYGDETRKHSEYPVKINYMRNYSNGVWVNYKNYLSRMPDTDITLDSTVTFQNDQVERSDYVSKRVPYALEPGDYSSWDELIGTLYDTSERYKIEWAIGAIVAGIGKDIQKFLVLYGESGTGKSTILNIIAKLFQGYVTTFEAKALASNNNSFSTENFRNNPLVAIQHDGDLSRIEDNTKLNSIISHEMMELHEKYKPSYTARLNCFLFMGTNKPVKITDSKSGIIRRLIDVKPSGRLIPINKYNVLMNRIDFELGAIASHCLDVFNMLGVHYYDKYKPFEMIYQTDVFFNFVQENMFTFKNQNGCTLRQAWDMYKEYCDDAAVPFKLPMYKFRDELKDYFDEFKEVTRVDGKQVRSYFSGFKMFKMTGEKEQEVDNTPPVSLSLDSTESLLDKELADQPAQYASMSDKPTSKWENVTTTLKDLDTSKVHYVKVPENHIVIDFDLKDENGNKDAVKNLEAASKWPPTYAEFSKGGSGVHLHYIYDGDPKTLSAVYDEGIEVKVFSGNSSLRRRLTKCNAIPIAHISTGLPMKGAKPVINYDTVTSERSIRNRIEKALAREYHPNTAPSISLIYKILEDAYNSGTVYDVTDLRPKILAFAMQSSHQADFCVNLVAKMKFKSEVTAENTLEGDYDDKRLVFFDVEVFPNLFLINWKFEGAPECVRMVNPTPQEVEKLFKLKLVGFNCRRYDNHILYARYLGYDNQKLFMLSQRLVNNSKNATFSEAYNISYTDVYDFASAGNKKSLKKFEVELRIHHQELGLPWDEDVPEELWEKVAEYCDNDVFSTEIVFNHLKSDWIARQILAKISGLSVNDTTNQHSTRIIFGGNKTPQNEFLYRNLAEPVKEIPDDVREYLKENTPLPLKFKPVERDGKADFEESILPYFPGYTFEKGKSLYRGIEVGEGGEVYAEPGIYWNVALLDIASMHPTSMECECLFGPRYSKIFSQIKQARIAIKHKDKDALNNILDGALVEFVKGADNGEFSLDDLSSALKTVINSVYGLTAASFENAFRDPRNKDNIVAKRGALFMIDLMNEVKRRGFTVAHIKTDSIKIPNATPEIIQFVMDFGKMYGYTFELESVYEKMCLINDAVYIAKVKSGKHEGQWVPTGARFAHPYVFKTLFSKEPIEFDDLCEAKSVVSGYMYLDFNEQLPDVSKYEKDKMELVKKVNKGLIPVTIAEPTITELTDQIAKGHSYQFVGKTGLFVPISDGFGGGKLVRFANDKYDSVTGCKDYRWAESEIVKANNQEESINMAYYRALVDDALDKMREVGDIEPFFAEDQSIPPWCSIEDCTNCPNQNKCDMMSAALVQAN